MKVRILIGIIVFMSFFSCEQYEDYVVDTIGHTTVYFPRNELPRSIVSGEGLAIKIGVVLGGVRANDVDRTVEFVIEPSLLDSSDYELLPSNYYTLSSLDKIVIPAGSTLGFVDVQFDSEQVRNDQKFDSLIYALPLRIVSTSADSILLNMDHTIIPLKLMSTYEGNYFTYGQVKEFLTVRPVLNNAFVYGDSLKGPQTIIKDIQTISMDSVLVNGVDTRGAEVKMLLKINQDNSVLIIPDDDVFQVEPNRESRWDPVKRRFFLSYKYDFLDKKYEVEELLTFRNRNRDGIDEWRWDGFPGN